MAVRLNIAEHLGGKFIAFNFRLHKFDGRRASRAQGAVCFRILLHRTKQISEETGIDKVYLSTDMFQSRKPKALEAILVSEQLLRVYRS